MKKYKITAYADFLIYDKDGYITSCNITGEFSDFTLTKIVEANNSDEAFKLMDEIATNTPIEQWDTFLTWSIHTMSPIKNNQSNIVLEDALPPEEILAIEWAYKKLIKDKEKYD